MYNSVVGILRRQWLIPTDEMVSREVKIDVN
jgi:hypothetical protein